jgi:hypothetical protein
MPSLNMGQARAVRVVMVEWEETVLSQQQDPRAETVARVEPVELQARVAMAAMAGQSTPCIASPSVERSFIQTRPVGEDMAAMVDLVEMAGMGGMGIMLEKALATVETPATPEPVELVEAGAMVAVAAASWLPMVH